VHGRNGSDPDGEQFGPEQGIPMDLVDCGNMLRPFAVFGGFNAVRAESPEQDGYGRLRGTDDPPRPAVTRDGACRAKVGQRHTRPRPWPVAQIHGRPPHGNARASAGSAGLRPRPSFGADPDEVHRGWPGGPDRLSGRRASGERPGRQGRGSVDKATCRARRLDDQDRRADPPVPHGGRRRHDGLVGIGPRWDPWSSTSRTFAVNDVLHVCWLG